MPVNLLQAFTMCALVQLCLPSSVQAQVISQATSDLIETIQGGQQSAIEQAIADFEQLPEAEQSQIISEVASLDPALAAQLTQQLEAAGLIGAGAAGGLTATALGATLPIFITALLGALASTGGGSTPDTQ